jgi:hypothetical protein
MKTAKSAIDPIARARINRQRVKPKASILAACLTGLLFVSSGIADSKTFTSSSSGGSTRIGSARVVNAIGGGSFVTGTTEPWFGYVPARIVHAHVAAYDHNGKLLSEKTAKINHSHLVRWHLRSRPRASYAVFFPYEASQIAKVAAWAQ